MLKLIFSRVKLVFADFLNSFWESKTSKIQKTSAKKIKNFSSHHFSSKSGVLFAYVTMIVEYS